MSGSLLTLIFAILILVFEEQSSTDLSYEGNKGPVMLLSESPDISIQQPSGS
jgi:hypothetical protein